MSEAVALMQALLGTGTARAQAEAALTEALLAELDPLRWCALHLRRSEAEIMARAAAWADLAFFDVVPRLALPSLTPSRLEMLADIRILRATVLDREVAFAAPDFLGIIRLKAAVQVNRTLRNRLCLIPPAVLRELVIDAAGEALVDGARQTLARSWPHAAAQLDLTRPLRWLATVLMLALVAVLLAAPLLGHVWLAPFWIVLVALPALLRYAALAVPVPLESPVDDFGDDPAAWPAYSALVPLRDEADMVDQLAAALARLDYPPGRLEVVFVVESRSAPTIAAIRRHLDNPRFSLVIVPDALPHTKPKALDFALPLCRGDFVVVFDAEDRPEPDQLRRVASQFRRRPELDCVQARLVVANGERGWLQALFAGEYAGLFTVIVPALAEWGLVVPLGGTSNHFRLATLRRLGGWDAYNVTEDADLGVRLARRGLRTGVTTSVTLEDAPVAFRHWLGQRTRWMKGWMQTFVVHNRRPRLLLADLGWWRWLMFHVVILGMLLAPLLHAGFLLLLLCQLLLGRFAWPATGIWPLACLLVFMVGYGSALATNMVGLGRTGQTHLRPAQLLTPVYWLMVAWATLRAFVEFARRPFHWFKTPHTALSGAASPDRQSASRASALSWNAGRQGAHLLRHGDTIWPGDGQFHPNPGDIVQDLPGRGSHALRLTRRSRPRAGGKYHVVQPRGRACP